MLRELNEIDIYESFDKCPVCNNPEIKLTYITKDRHYKIEDDFKLFKCTNCDLVFLNPLPTQEFLSSLYPKDYYAYQSFFKKQSWAEKFVKKYLVRAITKDPTFQQPGKMLDIGCGSGHFIYKMRENGWDVKGVEINDDAAKLGREAGKLNIHSGELVTALYANEEFDYIRSNHSFEHVVQAKELLQEIHRVLKKDGKLLIGVPNIDGLNAKLFKKYWWYLGAPVHTFNYTPKSLSMLLEAEGFKVEKVNYNSDYSGILGSTQIFLNRNTNKTSMEGWVFNNPFLRIFFHQIAKVLDLFKQGDVIEIVCTKAS